MRLRPTVGLRSYAQVRACGFVSVGALCVLTSRACRILYHSISLSVSLDFLCTLSTFPCLAGILKQKKKTKQMLTDSHRQMFVPFASTWCQSRSSLPVATPFATSASGPASSCTDGVLCVGWRSRRAHSKKSPSTRLQRSCLQPSERQWNRVQCKGFVFV